MKTTIYNAEDMADRVNTLREILGLRYWYCIDHLAHRGTREWYSRIADKHQLHPAIWDAIRLAPPKNWHQLVLEHPYRAETDPNRLAYIRDERSGEADRQTLTTIGKYLARHFDLADHDVRDIVARHTCTSEIKTVHTVKEMVHAVNNGPQSCMKWRSSQSITCTDGIERHPYEVYDPEYGWHMVLRYDGEEIVGRALCMAQDGDATKYWVRSFKKCPSGGTYSNADEYLEAWLKGRGYEHRSGYRRGERMAYYKTDSHDTPLAPYLDGDDRGVDIAHGGDWLEIDEGGEYIFENTNGVPEGGAERSTCDHCGDSCDEDDLSGIGEEYETRVCGHCLDNHYTCVIGRRGEQYYISDRDAVSVGDEQYDPEYLSANDIVELHNGDYAHIDNAVCVESEGEWYEEGDDEIVRDHNGDYQLIDNCWQCEETSEWYTHDEVSPVEVDGCTYHPDNAPEVEEAKAEEISTNETVGE